MAALALDLATKTGWALYGEGMERPHFGTVELPASAGHTGRPCEALRQFLADMHDMHGLTAICFEAQHVGGKIDMNVVNRLLALAGMAEWFGYRIGLEDFTFRANISTWRKHFIGHGGTGLGREKVKQMCLDQCRLLGFHPPDDNAAEAFGILDYYLSLRKRDIRIWRDNAFMKGVLVAPVTKAARKALVERER